MLNIATFLYSEPTHSVGGGSYYHWDLIYLRTWLKHVCKGRLKAPEPILEFSNL